MRSTKLLFLALSLSGLYANAGAQTVSQLIGQPAPDFELTDTSGQRLPLRTLKGTVVVLDFWATWCPPCREELPILNRIAQDFASRPISVLGIDAAEDPDTVRRFLQATPLAYRILLTYDNDSPLRDYGVAAYPFVVLIDRNGIIAGAGNFPADTLEETLRAKFENLLATGYVSPRAQAPEQSRQLRGVIYPDMSFQAFSPPIPLSAEQLFLQASLDFRMNRLSEALQEVSSCLSTRKAWLPALRLRARVYSRLGRYKEAINDYTAILNKSSGDAETYELRAESFLADNQRERAVEDYRHATDLDPYETDACLQLSSIYLSARQLDLAQKAIERVIERTPDSVPAYQIRAQIEKERGDWNDELADLDRMLILEPANSWAKSYRPDVLLRIAHLTSKAKTDDTYEVYSAVLMHPIWNHADDDSLLLIAEDTGLTYGGMDPAKCITAPSDYKARVDQIFATYEARKSFNVRLGARFRISRPFKLLNAAECSQFTDLRFRGKQPDSQLAELFKKTPDLIRLSQVFFSEDHTVAMVLVSNYCGGLCGGEKWRVLVKRNGSWIDQDWVGCMTVS